MMPGIVYCDADPKESQSWFSFYLGGYLHLDLWTYSDMWLHGIYNNPLQDDLSSDDEQPIRELFVPGFRISAYQVTFSQFALFINDRGYARREFWTDAGWAHRERQGWTTPKNWSSPVDHIANNAVVGVSWFEACAFCRWASEAMGTTIRLPTEAEWEKAARGTDGRRYPYGDEFNPHHSNSELSGIGRVCAVGLFPAGRSPYGIWDCSGNVWEWCSTHWRESYLECPNDTLEGRTKRCLRGGSWWDKNDIARVTCRSKFEPHIRYDDGGFRVASALEE